LPAPAVDSYYLYLVRTFSGVLSSIIARDEVDANVAAVGEQVVGEQAVGEQVVGEQAAGEQAVGIRRKFKTNYYPISLLWIVQI